MDMRTKEGRNVKCPECKSLEVQSWGVYKGRDGVKRKARCTACGRVFYLEKRKHKKKG